MLKVVVYDSGYGGEFFADALEAELPIAEVIRVIDWRNADRMLVNSRSARKLAEHALRPYIGRVDLIIFANYLISLTSLKYFRRKYKKQQFLGLSLKNPDTFVKRDIMMLTTKAVTRTIKYHNFIFHSNRKIKTLTIDSWPTKIDDGELTLNEIKNTIKAFIDREKLHPKEIILACSQLNDIKTELRAVLGGDLKIYDSFKDTIYNTYRLLDIRGGVRKKKK